MGPRRLLVLFLALIVAGVTAVYARSWINEQQRPITVVQPSEPAVENASQVLVAETDIPSGRFIKPQDIRWQPWPGEDIPDNYIVKGDADETAVVGAVVRRGLFAGQPITDAGVVKPGDRGFLAAVLSPGMRAASVPINATSGNSGLIFPGDRVDLILTQTLDGDDTTRRVSETVLPDIRIIAMGVDTGDDAKEGRNHEKARTATLEVTPRQAESVALVTELGKLSLSLRSLARNEEGETAASVPADYVPTWDKDVSSVLRSGRHSNNRLLVLRGSDAETVNVEGSN